MPLSISADWVQPSYYDALEMAKQRSSDWGFPVGVRAAADWQNCGTPTVAQGFDAGEELECSASTCMLKCPAGQIAVGKRRIRCRWKRKHGKIGLVDVSAFQQKYLFVSGKTVFEIFTYFLGFFWKSQLGSCQGCEPTDPVASITDSNITASCSANAKGKNICMLRLVFIDLKNYQFFIYFAKPNFALTYHKHDKVVQLECLFWEKIAKK